MATTVIREGDVGYQTILASWKAQGQPTQMPHKGLEWRCTRVDGGGAVFSALGGNLAGFGLYDRTATSPANPTTPVVPEPIKAPTPRRRPVTKANTIVPEDETPSPDEEEASES